MVLTYAVFLCTYYIMTAPVIHIL